MNADRGNWMMLAGGRKFHPFDPRPEDIDIDDIAHALSHVCRFGGHVRRFYSVAEHSVLVARCVPKIVGLAALLHDAAEAYLGDIPRPIKHSPEMDGWRKAEARVERAIAARFSIGWPMDGAIKQVDDRIILDEWAALMPATREYIGVSGEPLGVRIEGWSPCRAAAEFLDAFEQHGGQP